MSWIHFGDLHIKGAGEQNHLDLQALVARANRDFAGQVSFAVLPGDNADDASEDQFRLVRDAVSPLRIPLHILPGDHDFHTRSLQAFYAVLGAQTLPYAVTVAGVRCLFFDVVSAGSGGPDFRLDGRQLDWAQAELEAAAAAGEQAAIFMHAYPADLREGADRLQALLARPSVRCVDMGHTHYNELANDGRTVFMATRSTGQIEEGPVGFSVAAIDAGVVSWTFRPLAESGPAVLITSPADHRLIIDPACASQVIRGDIDLRARIWHGAGVRSASASVGEEEPIALTRSGETLWEGRMAASSLADGLHRVMVRAEGADGLEGSDTITVRVHAGGDYAAPFRHGDGSDKDALGAWHEKGIMGTQLGPNRNGRKW